MTTITTSTSDAEALRVTIDRQNLDMRTATPAYVVAVKGNRVDVQPAIALTRRVEGVQSIPLPVVRDVPLMMLGSTKLGLLVVPPLGPGDQGLLIVSDRAIDNWQHDNADRVARTPDAETPRHHDITDAFFIPGAWRYGDVIADFPTDAIQMRNMDGTTLVSVSEDTVIAKVKGGAAMTMKDQETAFEGNVAIDGNLTITGVGGGQLNMTGDLTLDGSLSVTANVDVTGTVTADEFITRT